MNQIGILIQPNNEIIKRPIAITVICILGFIGAVLSVPMIFSEIAIQIGKWFPPYSGFVAIVSLVCMIGLWFAKRWAAYAYTGLVVFNQIVLISMERWNILILIIQGIVVIVTLSYLDTKVKDLLYQLVRYIKRQIWTIIVAYMVGIHNFYKQEDKTPDDIGIVVENIEKQEDSAPK